MVEKNPMLQSKFFDKKQYIQYIQPFDSMRICSMYTYIDILQQLVWIRIRVCTLCIFYYMCKHLHVYVYIVEYEKIYTYWNTYINNTHIHIWNIHIYIYIYSYYEYTYWKLYTITQIYSNCLHSIAYDSIDFQTQGLSQKVFEPDKPT